MSDYQTWKQNTLGNHYDVDNSGDYDCVDIPKLRAVDLYGDWVRTIGYGNAKDLYNGASDTYFEKIANDPANPDQLPIQGDIIVFSETPYPGYTNQYSNPYGHTGVVDSCDSNGYTIISQSSGTGNPAQLHTSGWHFRHCIGWLRPKDLTPPPAPAPDPYTLTDIAPKQITINRPTHRWNMGYSDLQQMKDNPVESLATGAGPYTVTVACHQNGSNYDYLLENRNNLGGFNIYDCADYVVPYTEPVELPPAPKVWPSAPITAGSTVQYEVVKLLDGYETSTKAINRIQPPFKPVGAGRYYVFNMRSLDTDPNTAAAINVSEVLGQPGVWINVADNLPEVIPEPVVVVAPPVLPPPISDWSYKPLTPVEMPVPTPTPELTSKGTVVLPNWRSTYKPFTDQAGSPQPVWYIAQRDFVISDLSTTRPSAPVKEEQRILIAGQFVGPDDLIYGRPQEALYDKAGNVRFWWYGCPMDRDHVLTEKESNRLYDTSITKVEKQALKVIHDIEAIDHKQARQIRQNSLKLEDQIYHNFAKGTNLVTKFMDIINNRSKR